MSSYQISKTSKEFEKYWKNAKGILGSYNPLESQIKQVAWRAWQASKKYSKKNKCQ